MDLMIHRVQGGILPLRESALSILVTVPPTLLDLSCLTTFMCLIA